MYPPPQFVVPLRDVQQVEGGKIHFEGRIEPVGDPTMRVEWLLNGQLLAASKLSSLSALKINTYRNYYFCYKKYGFPFFFKIRFSNYIHFQIWIHRPRYA